MPSSYFFTASGMIDSKPDCLSLNAERLVAAPLGYDAVVTYWSSLEFLAFEFMKVMLFLGRFVLYALSKRPELVHLERELPFACYLQNPPLVYLVFVLNLFTDR